MAPTRSAPRGIYQLDKDAYLRSDGTPTPGYRDFRGSIETTGQFALSDKWTWGWDGILPTDPTFFQNYGLSTYQRGSNILVERPDRGRVAALPRRPWRPQLFRYARHLLLRLFRSRRAERKFRASIRWSITSYVFGQPVLGGELSYRTNLTSLSRSSARFQSDLARGIRQRPLRAHHRRPGRERCPPIVCSAAFRAAYTRVSGEMQWKRSITDSFGQVFTPFVKLRADAAAISVTNSPGVANYLAPGDSAEFRVMPTVGSRVPLSVHQHATLGHPDHRADRASHRAAE